MNSSELREQRALLITEAKDLCDKADAEKRDMNEEENDRYNKLTQDIDNLAKDICRVEKREHVEALTEETKKVAPRKAPPVSDRSLRAREDLEKRHDAFRAWLMADKTAPTSMQLRAAEECGVNINSRSLTWNFTKPQARALGLTNTAGGYTQTVNQPGFAEYLKWFCAIRNYCQVINTDNGNELPFATADDTSSVGERLGENTAFNELDTTFGQVVLRSYAYNSKLMRISRQLVTDSSIDIEDYVARQLATRIGRIQETEFVFSGNGNSMPKSLVNSAASGKTSFDVTKYTDWTTLLHSVDKAYRNAPAAAWVMHDTTVLALRNLVDDNHRPLLIDSTLQMGSVDRFLGYPVVTSNSMDYTGSSKKVALFGDLSQFVIRDVGSVEILRSDDLYMNYNQVAIVAFQRSDANFIGPSSSLKYGITA